MSDIKDSLNIMLSKILSVQFDRKARCLNKNVVKLNCWEIKDISQRELAKLTGISRSTLNDLIVTASAKNKNAINFYNKNAFEEFNLTLTMNIEEK